MSESHAMMKLLFSFDGRINRLAWWCGSVANFVLVIIFVIALSVVAVAVSPDPEALQADVDNGTSIVPALFMTAYLPMIWIGFALGFKRYHDRGKSGAWIAVGFIPIVGPIWQLVELGFLGGDDGPNDHGPEPDGIGVAQSANSGGSSKAAAQTAVWAKDKAALKKPRPAGETRAQFGLRGT
jgi:uncharacterized membrane protein YhaH (DUF805 family)